MKFALATVLLAALCLTHANGQTALFGSVSCVNKTLAEFTNKQLEKSFDYLLLSYTFDTYDLHRPGFKKLYRKISDKAWEDTEALIKYQTRRGLVVDLGQPESPVLAAVDAGKLGKESLLLSSEKSSLELALNYEKHLADESHEIHRQVSHAHEAGSKKEPCSHGYDPDVAHYLDEEIIEYQSGVIRKLSGYIHNLNDIMKEDDGNPKTKELGIHLFDEYLDKAE